MLHFYNRKGKDKYRHEVFELTVLFLQKSNNNKNCQLSITDVLVVCYAVFCLPTLVWLKFVCFLRRKKEQLLTPHAARFVQNSGNVKTKLVSCVNILQCINSFVINYRANNIHINLYKKTTQFTISYLQENLSR